MYGASYYIYIYCIDIFFHGRQIGVDWLRFQPTCLVACQETEAFLVQNGPVRKSQIFEKLWMRRPKIWNRSLTRPEGAGRSGQRCRHNNDNCGKKNYSNQWHGIWKTISWSCKSIKSQGRKWRKKMRFQVRIGGSNFKLLNDVLACPFWLRLAFYSWCCLVSDLSHVNITHFMIHDF